MILGVAGALALLSMPLSALASTYTWSMPGDFTVAKPGANPDHDHYGARPWSYRFDGVQLPSFLTGFDGGLTGWTVGGSDPSAFVAANPTGGTVVAPLGGTFAAGQLAMQPPSKGNTALQWTAPKSGTVRMSGTVAPADAGLGCAGIIWSLTRNGSTLTGSPAESISISGLPVSAGDRMALTVVDNPANTLLAGCNSAAATLQIQEAAAGSAPAVTLTSPAPGAVVSGDQPVFAGSGDTGFDAAPTVTVRIYKGSAPSGQPVEALTAAVVDGAYQVQANPNLDNGTYTAQTEQDSLDSPPLVGLSVPVTFEVHNGVPSIRLNSPGGGPLRTSTPTLSGIAATGSGNAGSVSVAIYPGSSSQTTPVRTVSGSVAANGDFSVRVSPGLPDGRYTAVAEQAGASLGFSSPVVFRIKVHPPAVTVTAPGPGAAVSSLRFSGAAGTALGDSSRVSVTLYRGGSAKHHKVGTIRVRATGGHWSASWPRQLPLGLYTVRASQTDDAGHVGVTQPRRFLLVSGPSVIGNNLMLQGNVASLPVTCLAPAGTVCHGTVLALTVRHLRPVPGGPSGPIRIIFAYVSLSAGRTVVIHQSLLPAAARALRQAAPVRVDVMASLGGAVGNVSATRTLKTR